MIDRKDVPVLMSNMDKDSELSQFFNEYWKFVKEFLNGKEEQREKEYWDELVSRSQEMSEKYNGQYKQFCIELLLSLIAEIERRDREERQSCKNGLQIKLIKSDTGKNSKLFQFFSEYWKMIKDFLNGKDGHREKDYWNEIAKTSFQITKKYNEKFERDIVNGLIEEIKRRDHKECGMTLPMMEPFLLYLSFANDFETLFQNLSYPFPALLVCRSFLSCAINPYQK